MMLEINMRVIIDTNVFISGLINPRRKHISNQAKEHSTLQHLGSTATV